MKEGENEKEEVKAQEGENDGVSLTPSPSLPLPPSLSPPLLPPLPPSPSLPPTTSPSPSSIGTKVSLFTGCPVDDIPYLRFGEIDCFEKARKLFLRATSRIEEAKKVFPLDGKSKITVLYLEF